MVVINIFIYHPYHNLLIHKHTFLNKRKKEKRGKKKRRKTINPKFHALSLLLKLSLQPQVPCIIFAFEVIIAKGEINNIDHLKPFS